MGRMVIASYKPKEGMSAELQAVLAKHMQILRDQGLVTDREAYVMVAANGAFLEVFEWQSPQAIEQAHQNPAVLTLWDEFSACCEYIPLADIPETQSLFAEFEPIAL